MYNLVISSATVRFKYLVGRRWYCIIIVEAAVASGWVDSATRLVLLEQMQTGQCQITSILSSHHLFILFFFVKCECSDWVFYSWYLGMSCIHIYYIYIIFLVYIDFYFFLMINAFKGSVIYCYISSFCLFVTNN